MPRRAPWNAHKKRRQYYSGKKRRHTQKAQLVVDQAGRQIICAAIGKGREHDFKLLKRSAVRIAPTIECLGDRGYQGLRKRHAKSRTPTKKPRSGQWRKTNYGTQSERGSRFVESILTVLATCQQH